MTKNEWNRGRYCVKTEIIVELETEIDAHDESEAETIALAETLVHGHVTWFGAKVTARREDE